MEEVAAVSRWVHNSHREINGKPYDLASSSLDLEISCSPVFEGSRRILRYSEALVHTQ